MSWDVLVMNYGGEPPREIAEADPVGPLGLAEEVRSRIDQHLPGIDWSEPTWGVYEGDGFTIEFNMGDEDPVPMIMLHVRGGGDPISAMLALANPHGWSLLDASTSQLIDPENPSAEGWEGFQGFRDKVLGPTNEAKPEPKTKKAKKPKPKAEKRKPRVKRPKALAKKAKPHGRQAKRKVKTPKRPAKKAKRGARRKRA